MANFYIDIDPDGDTLVILPFVNGPTKTDDAAECGYSLPNNDEMEDDPPSSTEDDSMDDADSLSGTEEANFC